MFDTWTGWTSLSISLSVFTKIALSTPIANAVLKISSDFYSPIVSAVTSETNFCSFSLIASSTAMAQKGFMLIFMPYFSTPWRFFNTLILAL